MAEVFRKQALDRAASPEHLDDYIKVSNPGIWIVLAACVVFLAGIGIWCVFGRIADVQTGVVQVEHGTATCYIDQTAAASLSEGDKIEVSGVEGSVLSVDTEPQHVSGLNHRVYQKLKPTGAWVATAKVAINLPNGTYPADVTVAEYEPISLLLDRS